MTDKGQEASTSARDDDAKRTSRAVGRNVARLRGGEGISARELAERVSARGVRMGQSGVADIERGRRTVSVDQLTALADALGVSPLALLMPHSMTGDAELVSLTGVDSGLGLDVWNWLRADYPLHHEPRGDAASEHEAEVFRRRSTPPWAWSR